MRGRAFANFILLFCTLFLVCALFFSVSLLYGGQNSTANSVTSQMKQAQELKKHLKVNPELNKYYKDMQKQAWQAYQAYRRNQNSQIRYYEKQVRSILGYYGGPDYADKYSPATSEWHNYLAPDERIYIFMSSSVPFVTWDNYARELDRLRDPNIVMVLRGCIGGCQFVKPTIRFLQRIIIPGLENIDFSQPGWQEEIKKRARHVQVWIDPLLFRYYHITAVPCFVFAKGVNPITGGSEGYAGNLRGRPEFYKVCGDWNLNYMLSRLYQLSGSESINSMLRALNKSWFESQSKEK